MTDFEDSIPVERLRGLHPSAWVCVGPGFAREEIKGVILARGQGIVSDAVVTIHEICGKLLGVSAQKVLGTLARQEVLRLLLAERRISSKMPELKRLRRQSRFFRRLDQAMQSGRAAFAHDEEGQVYSERLEQVFGPSPLRAEMKALAQAYEAWLEASSLWDPPLLIRVATETLGRQGWPEGQRPPGEIHYFSAVTQESLEKGFWDTLSQTVQVHFHGPLVETQASQSTPLWDWQLWHTLDDAAESLAEELASGEKPVSEIAVLTSEQPATRRSLKRALAVQGVPEADPRDPMEVKWEEAIKWALSPLDTVVSRFERQRTVSWMGAFLGAQDGVADLIGEINERGIKQGLSSYQGGKLALVHSALSDLGVQFGGRKTLAELQVAHIEYLKRPHSRAHESPFDTVSFVEKIWSSFVEDMDLLGQSHLRAPLLFWYQRLSVRIQETPAPVRNLKPQEGLRIYRLSQAPLFAVPELLVFGLPSSWLAGDRVGDYWFTERERELLSGEFLVRSRHALRAERLACLRSWLENARSVRVFDASYEADGRERESILPILNELGSNAQVPCQEKGSHPRWARSFGTSRPVQPQSVKLAPLVSQANGAPPVITASSLDRYSRCSFQALALHRWRLWDIREPDTELWPNVRGDLLHYAVMLLKEREGSMTPAQALEQAWKIKPPKGLIRGQRITAYVKSRLLEVLLIFAEKEQEYLTRARTSTLRLESEGFGLSFPEFTLLGTPDRIDENSEGLFILDYKTASASPSGSEMLEKGYRLQLPAYALSAQRKLGRPVLGAGFVELTRKGSRSSGVFFTQYNGKEAGKLTQLRSNSKSLLAGSSDDTWGLFEEQIRAQGTDFVSGRFTATPRKGPSECQSCWVGDLCGLRRVLPSSPEPEVLPE